MQLILVAIVIAWPASVTYWLGGQKTLDPTPSSRDCSSFSCPRTELREPPSFDLGPLKLE